MNIRLLAASFVISGLTAGSGWAQQGGFNPQRIARDALSEPFTGMKRGEKLQEGLFHLRSTGVPTTPVVNAAQAFVDSLTAGQRAKVLFPVDDPEWRNWANIHRFRRQGVSLEEMTAAQRANAYALLRVSLSAKGYETSRDIMRLNHHLGELASNFDEYGEHLYWFTVMGNPSGTEPWGWQIDGHHLIINYFVRGDQIVMTPTFMGSEPVHARSGKYAGTSILEAEQELGLRFMQSLPPEHQKMALMGQKQGRSENIAEMFRDNVMVPLEGLRAGRLNGAQREKLIELIDLYVGNIRDGHAAIKLDEVRAHIGDTYFAWKGGVGPDAVFYYRIHSPVIFIEFDHQGPIALDGPRRVPTRRHVHTVVRTPNGNDYGKDLLRQHYEAHKNDPAHGHVPR
ncbi:MAG: DUF3500 domain-containing protein [Alphaproteobacteria bacterium]